MLVFRPLKSALQRQLVFRPAPKRPVRFIQPTKRPSVRSLRVKPAQHLITPQKAISLLGSTLSSGSSALVLPAVVAGTVSTVQNAIASPATVAGLFATGLGGVASLPPALFTRVTEFFSGLFDDEGGAPVCPPSGCAPGGGSSMRFTQKL